MLYFHLGHHFLGWSGVFPLGVDLHYGWPGRGKAGGGSPGHLRGGGGEGGGGGDQLLGVRVVQLLQFFNCHPPSHSPKICWVNWHSDLLNCYILPESLTGVVVHLRVSAAKVRPGGAGGQVTPGEETVQEHHDDDQEDDADTDADQEGGAGGARVLVRDHGVWVIPARPQARGILRWRDWQPPQLLLSHQAPGLGGILDTGLIMLRWYKEFINVHFQMLLSHP